MNRAKAVADDARQSSRMALLGLVVVMAAGLMLSACNTTAGVGKDVAATGNAVTRSANDVKTGL